MDVDATTCGETVGRLARRFGLSRSALLYYHRIGLLVPSMGGDGRYRRYTHRCPSVPGVRQGKPGEGGRDDVSQ